MPGSTDCWGIEVGANAVKAIRLQRSGNQVTVADFEVMPFKKILTTPDLDVDEAIRVNLDQFLLKHDLKRTTVMVSVPGHMSFARFAKLPPVEPKKIPDIVKFEAVQQIPFPIEEVEWDYQTFQDAESPDVEVGIFAITKTRLHPWLQHFRAMNINVDGVVLSPVAVLNAMNHDLDLRDRPNGTILMDIGTQATELIIAEGNRVWLRTIPLGGNHFTDALVKSFKLSFTKAEKLKREAATSKYARQIFQAMRPVFVDLVQEVQKSLGYYQSLNRDADLSQLIGLGSTFRLPGLQTFIKQQLQMEVKRLDEFHKIEAEGRDAATFAENTLSLAPAYGLALQGVGMERVTCNLLPLPVVRQQVWKRKNKWFAASAAAVVAGVGLAYGSLKWTQASYNTADNDRLRRQVDAIVGRADDAWSNWRAALQQNDPRPKIHNITSMLDMRSLWPSIIRDIDRAMVAVDPQQALLDGNAAAIDQIPREQRRYLGIERVTASYAYRRPAADGGTRRGGPGPTDVDWRANPPVYRIVLSGFTPYNTPEESTSDFLQSRFIQQLVDDANQAHRPYYIPNGADNVKIRSLNRIGGLRPDAPTGQPAPQSLQQTLLPEPVLEPQPGDSQFVIEWEVWLRDPEDVQKLLGDEPEPSPVAQPGPADDQEAQS